MPSLKDYEHQLRGEEETHFDIRRENKRTTDFNKLLRSADFKGKLAEFLIEDWIHHEFVVLCQNKKVILNYDRCYVFEVAPNNVMRRTINYDLTCDHEEADTKIVYHVCSLNTNQRIRVHCTDSDIPVIMLTNFQFRKGDTEVVIDMSTRNKGLYLDINTIYNSLGPQISRSLAVCHIFTGNDFNPSFYRKGKKKPFNI